MGKVQGRCVTGVLMREDKRGQRYQLLQAPLSEATKGRKYSRSQCVLVHLIHAIPLEWSPHLMKRSSVSLMWMILYLQYFSEYWAL